MTEPAPPHRTSTAWKVAPWVVAVVAVLFALWWMRDRPSDTGSAAPPPGTGREGTASADADEAAPLDPLRERWREATGFDPVWPEPFPEAPDCTAALSDLRRLATVLDSRDYVREHRHEGGTLGFLARVSADLEANPPPVHGELRDVLDVRHSVSHLYRTLGEKRLLQLSEMIALEPDLAEPMAMALFRWASARDRCEPAAMGPRSRYTYATWLLRTVGGQAYLRRRTPRLEALATFYAVVELDRAIAGGYDPSGVDLRDDIARTRELIKGRDDLVFRDRYLDVLREMEDRWTRRIGQRR
jgi:hypothetical protein